MKMPDPQPITAGAFCADLWCITAYFNPQRYQTRRDNYTCFAERLRESRVPLLTVECAVGDGPFDLPAGPNVIQVRSRDVLWQKERLLNLAVSRLPAHAARVVWLDNDILFSNPDWAVETARRLDEYSVVQPFDSCVRLPQGATQAAGDSRVMPGMAAVLAGDPSRLQSASLYTHGHTGFAWAAHRELLARCGLYDVGFDVGADHFMAHAFFGDWTGPCIQAITSAGALEGLARRQSRTALGRLSRRLIPQGWRRRLWPWHWRRVNEPLRRHFVAWASRFHGAMAGKVGYTPGTILHLWHGDEPRRPPGPARAELFRHGFDPAVDLRIGASGCWEWAVDKPGLRAWADGFFARRQEDGPDAG